MGVYQTVVVGTDGSDSSLRAVDRAGRLASGPGSRLIVVSAHQHPGREDRAAADVLKDEAYQIAGDAPVYAILRRAVERARAAGATQIEERAVVGAAVEVLIEQTEQAGADLLVVGNLGLNTVAGRLLGAVPTAVSRRAKVDVLIVHTTG